MINTPRTVCSTWFDHERGQCAAYKTETVSRQGCTNWVCSAGYQLDENSQCISDAQAAEKQAELNRQRAEYEMRYQRRRADIPALQSACESGDGSSCYRLADQYYYPSFVTPWENSERDAENAPKYLFYLEEGCALASSEACAVLAEIYADHYFRYEGYMDRYISKYVDDTYTLNPTLSKMYAEKACVPGFDWPFSEHLCSIEWVWTGKPGPTVKVTASE